MKVAESDISDWVPSSMQQAFRALVWMSERRTDEEIAVMQIPEGEVYLEQLERQWAEVEPEWLELRGFEHEGQALERIGKEYARHSELYLRTTVRIRTRINSAKATISEVPIQSAVHSNARFNSSQKLRNLLCAIKGRALDMLGQWTPNNGGSYEQAWLGLCNTYDNEYNTVQAHLRKINELRQIHRPTCSTIRQVLDTVRSAHRQLQVMLPADQVADYLLIYHIEGLLDAESLSQCSLRRRSCQR